MNISIQCGQMDEALCLGIKEQENQFLTKFKHTFCRYRLQMCSIKQLGSFGPRTKRKKGQTKNPSMDAFPHIDKMYTISS